tara:strand:- start:862 stop:1728 length:867 start_codon:yes stop_codon:yes gene_type:complete
MSFKVPTEIGLLGEKELRNVPIKSQDAGYGSSRQANQGAVIEFIPMHIKNTPVISFIAFLQDIKDNVRQEFTPTQPFGRTDPIQIWKSSTRTISLSFSIVSSDEEMALRNLNNLNWLVASSYPTYETAECANSIAATPLFRVKYANIIANTQNRNGLLCSIGGFNVTHELKNGAIHIHAGTVADLAKGAGFPSQADEILVAREITVGCELTVLHESSLGWDATTGEWRGNSKAGYPYGFGVIKDAGNPTSKGPGGTAESTDTKAATTGNPASVDQKVDKAKTNKILGG